MQNTLLQDTPALAVEHVTKTYRQWQRSGKLGDALKNLLRPANKQVTALDDLSLTVNRGEFVAYAGANGAGKSTTIKILSGILQPGSGQVRVLGLDPARSRVPLMRRIGVLFGNRSELWWDFPVEASFEWKRVVWDIDGDTYAKMKATVCEMLELGPLMNTFARELSLGQRMRADLGMLLLHNPEVIFLDEPTLGLDLLAKRQLINFLKHVNRHQGTTILVTSHDMEDLQEMADRIVLLSRGRIAYDGSFEALRLGGGPVRVRVVAEGALAPQMDGVELVCQQEGQLTLAVDPHRAQLGQVLAGLSGLANIREVEIQPPSIEDVIAGLYTQWAQQAPGGAPNAPHNGTERQ